MAALRLPRLPACGIALLAALAPAQAAEEPAHSAELDAAIVRAAKMHGIPERLVRRVVMRESRYNPRARNHSYWGLMQISYPTARSMGFNGSPEELLNPFVNLRYAVPYLANAFVAAGKREDAAVRLYAAGYYSTARHRGLLGALRTADSTPVVDVPEEPAPVAPAPVSGGLFSAFASAPAPQPQAPTQQLAYAADTQPAAASAQALQAVASARAPMAPRAKASGRAPVSSDKNSESAIAMVADRKGDLEPPKRWMRDGGRTVIARGEQPVEEIAASGHVGADKSEPRRSAHRHAHKSTMFAALEDVAHDQVAAAQPHEASAAPTFAATAAAAPVPAAQAAEASASAAQQQQTAAADPAADEAQWDDGKSHGAKARRGKRHAHARSHTRVARAEAAGETKVAVGGRESGQAEAAQAH